jgi:diguanylate cyclase (GGDEF)-like protein/PAS domain S-box-containing protein
VKAVVLTDGRDDDPSTQIQSGLLPAAVRDALPQFFVESALPLALIDAEGRLLAVNSGFCALIGRSANALADARLGDVLHPDDRIAHLAAWHALLGGITRADRVQARLVRPDGAAVPVVVYRTVVSHADHRAEAIGLAAFHDESGRLSGSEDASTVSRFATELAATETEPSTVGTVIARAVADLAGDGAWVWFIDDQRALRTLGAWHRDAGRRDVLTHALQHPLPTGSGCVGAVVTAARATRLAGTALPVDDPLRQLLKPYDGQFGTAGVLLVPLQAGGSVVAVLGVVRDGGAAEIEDDTMNQLVSLASTAALAVHNAIALRNVRADERFARSVLDAMPVMAAVMRTDGRIIDVNGAWLRAMADYGGLLHTGIGENYLHLWDTAAATGVIGAAEVAGGVRDVLNGSRDEFAGDCTYPRLNRSGDLTDLWFHVHAAPLALANGDDARMVLVDHHDITDRKRLEVRLSFEATHDPLTRLPNRTLLLDRVEQALARDRRGGVRTAVLFCDLDYFKQINDQLGHEGGDAVLRAVARRFAHTVRASDTVARIGGDEFVVLIESVSDLDEALLVADKLVLSLREPPPEIDSGDLPLPGVSVGVAVSNDQSTAESLLRDADAAMYLAKQTGRSRVQAAGPS